MYFHVLNVLLNVDVSCREVSSRLRKVYLDWVKTSTQSDDAIKDAEEQAKQLVTVHLLECIKLAILEDIIKQSL